MTNGARPQNPRPGVEINTHSGRFIDIPGQVAVNEYGEVVGADDAAAQARRTFQNLQLCLSALHATLDHVVKLTYYMTDIAYLSAINQVAEEFIGAGRSPAITAIQVSALFRPELLVQIEAVAFVPRG